MRLWACEELDRRLLQNTCNGHTSPVISSVLPASIPAAVIGQKDDADADDQ